MQHIPQYCGLGPKLGVTVSIAFDEPQTDDLRPAKTDPLVYRIWPPAVIALGLALSVAWTCLLGYQLVKLIDVAI